MQHNIADWPSLSCVLCISWLAEWVSELRHRLPSFKLGWDRQQLQQALGDIGYLDELPESHLQLLEGFLRSSQQQNAALTMALDEEFMADRVTSKLQVRWQCAINSQRAAAPFQQSPYHLPLMLMVYGSNSGKSRSVKASCALWMSRPVMQASTMLKFKRGCPCGCDVIQATLPSSTTQPLSSRWVLRQHGNVSTMDAESDLHLQHWSSGSCRSWHPQSSATCQQSV